MNQEEGKQVSLLFQGDFVNGEEEVGRMVSYTIRFQLPVEVKLVRIVRGGTIPHFKMPESVTQKGEEIDKLEVFMESKDCDRGFRLIASGEKLSEKGNHDSIIPIDLNYTVYYEITVDCNQSVDPPRTI
jgi:hypothetical protein